MKPIFAFLLTIGLCLPVAMAQESAQPAHWRFSDGAEFPGAAGSFALDEKGAGHLAFDFSQGGSYVGAYNDFLKPLHLAGVSFKVRKPVGAHLTARIVDSTGQTLQEPLFFEHGDWQPVRMDMVGFDGYFGGANDGLFHPPAKAFAILVESKDLDESVGEVAFKDVVFHLAAAGASGDPESPLYKGEYVVTAFDAQGGMNARLPHTLEDGRWKVDFSASDSALLGGSMSLLGTPQELMLTVEGGAPGMKLEIQMASHFQGFSRTIGALNGGTQTFTFPVPPEGWDHSGGENDGKVRLPLRITRVTLRRGTAAKGGYEIRLGALRCRTLVSRVDPVVLLSSAAVRENQKASTTCTAFNLLADAVTGAIHMKARDWEGAVLAEDRQAWTLPGKGVPTTLDFPMPLPADRNFVEVEYRFEVEGLESAETRTTYTRPFDGTIDPTLKPGSPWGMGVYLYRYPKGEPMERAAVMAAKAGVKWSREEFSWGRIETAPGVYNFDFYDSVVDTAMQQGISVYGLLSYWGRFTKPYTQEGIDDFCTWTRAVVRHFKGRVKHWEVYNEPNIFFWQGPKDLYPVLLKQCYAAIKEEDPEAVVLGISTAGIDTDFIQLCLDAEAPLDILTVHPYRGYFSEKMFMRELRDVAAMVNDKPVWITEMGWSTQVGASHERRQAQLLARCYLSAVASGACQNISWYDFRNDGDDPFYNEANFGVIHRDFTPKPAYRALATVCRTFGASIGKSRDKKQENSQAARSKDHKSRLWPSHFDQGLPQALALPDGLYGLRAGDVSALWSSSAPYRLPVTLAENTTVQNLMGETLSPPTTDGQQALILRPGAPVFLQGAYTITGKPVRMEGSVERSEILF